MKYRSQKTVTVFIFIRIWRIIYDQIIPFYCVMRGTKAILMLTLQKLTEYGWMKIVLNRIGNGIYVNFLLIRDD